MGLLGIKIPFWVDWIVVPALTLLLPPPWNLIVKALIKLIEDLPLAEKKEAKAEIVDSLKHFKETGDISKVEDTNRKWRQRCRGSICPTDTVSE